MSLCPEPKMRSEMTDAEFWDHVFNQGQTQDYDEPEPDEVEMAELHLSDRCPECGSYGACGYDDLGRPLIHTIPVDDDV